MDRRKFIKNIALTAALAGTAPSLLASVTQGENDVKQEGGLSSDQYKVLFIGDSITDGNRTRDNDWNHVLGHGFAYLIASRMWFEYPQNNLMFYNRGISGNRVSDLLKRWDSDVLDLKPNVISILVGINDVYFMANEGIVQTIEEFEDQYRQILVKTRVALPDSVIVLCEPFYLPGSRVAVNRAAWDKETPLRQQVVRRLAAEFNTLLVSLQQPFTQACKKAPAGHWIWDGIHPMPGGHELIAREWIKVVAKEIKPLSKAL